MTGNALLVPPRSAFRSREELCAFVSYKMRRATEMFTFKCSLYQRELKLYLPEPVPKHRRWIDTFDSESIVTIPVSKIEKDEIELFRKYFPDDMDLDSTFPGDLLQRSFKKRISSLLTSLVNKIVFLLVLKHDTWYVHQEARDGLREYLVERIWPKQPKMRLLYRDHVTTFVDTRIRHFRDSVGRYFRDLHANSKNGEAVANLIVTCDYEQSELDEMIEIALEEQKAMLESEREMGYVGSPNRSGSKESNRSLTSPEAADESQSRAQKCGKGGEESPNDCGDPSDPMSEIRERYEEIIRRSQGECRAPLEDLELRAQEMKLYYPDPEEEDPGKPLDQVQERRLALKAGARQRHRLKPKQPGRELGLEYAKSEELDGENGSQWCGVGLEKSEEPPSKRGHENRKNKRASSYPKLEQVVTEASASASAEAETELELELELEGIVPDSKNCKDEEVSPICSSPFNQMDLIDDYAKYYSLYSKGIQMNSSSQPVSAIPSMQSIQSISSSLTSAMPVSPSLSFQANAVSSFLAPSFVQGLNLITSQPSINSLMDKSSSIYSPFLFPQSNTENSASESNTHSNIVYRNIQTDSSSTVTSTSTTSASNSSVSNYSPNLKTCVNSTENEPLYSLTQNSTPEYLPSSLLLSVPESVPIFESNSVRRQKKRPASDSDKSSSCLESEAPSKEQRLGSPDECKDSDSKSSLEPEAPPNGYNTAPMANFPYYLGSMKDFSSVFGSQFLFPQPMNSMFQTALNVQAPPQATYLMMPSFNYPIQPLYPTQGGISQLNPYWLSSTDLSYLFPFDLSKPNGQPEINQMNPSNSVQ